MRETTGADGGCRIAEVSHLLQQRDGCRRCERIGAAGKCLELRGEHRDADLTTEDLVDDVQPVEQRRLRIERIRSREFIVAEQGNFELASKIHRRGVA